MLFYEAQELVGYLSIDHEVCIGQSRSQDNDNSPNHDHSIADDARKLSPLNFPMDCHFDDQNVKGTESGSFADRDGTSVYACNNDKGQE